MTGNNPMFPNLTNVANMFATYQLKKILLTDENGRPIGTELNEETTLEDDLRGVKLNQFKVNQTKIIEALQAKLLALATSDSVSVDVNDVCLLSDAIRANICIINNTNDIYPEE